MIFQRFLLASLLWSLASAQLKEGKGVFSYDNTADNGPPVWFTIQDYDDNQCGGDRQSPIGLNMITGCNIENADYTFDPGTCSADVLNYFNNDHSVEAEYPEDGCQPNTVTMPKIEGTYEIARFHTHTGSEHAFEGFHSNFELHLVHKLVEGSGTGTMEGTGITNTQAVVGYFIVVQDGETNEQFQILLDNWQAYQDAAVEACGGTGDMTTEPTRRKLEVARRRLQTFDVYSLSNPTAFYFYTGSLTTPPCTEDLWWNISNDPIYLSLDQGNQLAQLILGYVDENCELGTVADPYSKWTSRPLQPTNGRTVKRYCLGAAEPGEMVGDPETMPSPTTSPASPTAASPTMPSPTTASQDSGDDSGDGGSSSAMTFKVAGWVGLAVAAMML